MLRQFPICQRCGREAAVDVHEPLTRARGGSILDPQNAVTLCRYDHSWVHEHPAQATAEGWLQNSWEPDSAASARRAAARR
jgi:hypothetical protein